jgi:hypothetical protein
MGFRFVSLTLTNEFVGMVLRHARNVLPGFDLYGDLLAFAAVQVAHLVAQRKLLRHLQQIANYVTY